MKAWNIFSWQPPDWPEPPPVAVPPGVGLEVGPPHAYPVVIISHPARVANKGEVCVLLCGTGPANREPEAHEVMIDTGSGLYWPTLCRCDLFFLVKKSELKDRRGAVSAAERKRIIATIIRSNGWL
jgi:hypothetical protein